MLSRLGSGIGPGDGGQVLASPRSRNATTVYTCQWFRSLCTSRTTLADITDGNIFFTCFWNAYSYSMLAHKGSKQDQAIFLLLAAFTALLVCQALPPPSGKQRDEFAISNTIDSDMELAEAFAAQSKES